VTPNSSRRYPAHPLLGVGALIFGEQGVLLVERGRPPLEGYWSLPGGLVETGERLEDAVVREVSEETGLAVSPGRIATVFERIMPEESGRCEYHYVLVDFYCEVDGGQLQAGDDSKTVGWFAVSDLASLKLTEGTREIIEACWKQPVTNGYVTRPEAHVV
jgi:ADP-ribose pyrophosphatase YjhB (NUDIX family)